MGLKSYCLAFLVAMGAWAYLLDMPSTSEKQWIFARLLITYVPHDVEVNKIEINSFFVLMISHGIIYHINIYTWYTTLIAIHHISSNCLEDHNYLLCQSDNAVNSQDAKVSLIWYNRYLKQHTTAGSPFSLFKRFKGASVKELKCWKILYNFELVWVRFACCTIFSSLS